MMKNKQTIITIICVVVSLVLIGFSVFYLVADKDENGTLNNADAPAAPTRSEIAQEYTYNTQIETNADAPIDSEPEVEKITGFVEDKEQKFVSLPLSFEIKDGDKNINIIEIVAIGKYSGEYVDGASVSDVENALALVIKNPSDKVLSVASMSIKYDDGKVCSLTPSNIPPHQSALVLTNDSPVPYSDVKMLECTLDYAVPQKELPLIKDKVGVDFKDGKFIVTNLTDEYLGDVYIRYKKFADGNIYFGAVTYTACAQDVQPYETYLVDAPDYNSDNCIIIAVENHVGS